MRKIRPDVLLSEKVFNSVSLFVFAAQISESLSQKTSDLKSMNKGYRRDLGIQIFKEKVTVILLLQLNIKMQ